MGSRRPKRSGRAFGNQEIYALLPDAKAGHLTFQQESPFFLTKASYFGNRSPIDRTIEASVIGAMVGDANPTLFDTHSGS